MSSKCKKWAQNLEQDKTRASLAVIKYRNILSIPRARADSINRHTQNQAASDDKNMAQTMRYRFIFLAETIELNRNSAKRTTLKQCFCGGFLPATTQ